ncbi:MAG: hypothetical protein IJK42_01205 [Prevotella sp.]|nr:hypothetical protein [Prevotella sp.]
MDLKFDSKWRVNPMRFAMLMVMFFLFGKATDALAQKIDFNNGTGNNPTASGYIAWDITNGETVTNTFDGVTITITNAEGSAGSKIKKNWYKNGVTIGTDEGRLVCDGISSFDGDSYIKSGSVAIQVIITGLSAGTHTLQAYHNNVDYEAGATLPAINVKVNGTDQLTGLSQSMRATTLAASTKSYVTFDVSSTSSETVIIYYTTPVDGVTYDRTQLYINSLEFDGENADYQAQNPSPANLDYHVNADNENITLSWTGASGATKHIVYWGESEDQVNVKIYEGTNTYTTRSSISPLNTYYWRVDEVINGVTYKGVVWSFKSRRDAFPGAQGYGRYAIGGRGGTVYHVTSLDDDADNPAEGTFRYGITKVSGPRTIVFDVGGVIHLKNRLTCSDPYVTIAGQTAPGNGIMFRGAPFGMASDGITRFVRLRRGHLSDEDPDGHGMDGMGMAGNDHSIMDHCSISWTIDEAFSSRNAKHITLQNTLISEALNIAGHPNYDAGTEHGYAGTIGGGQLGAKGSSFHHNLLAHNEGRNWSMSGGLDASGAYDGHHDMFNNVCYNWATRATDGGTHEGQFVNNYYKMGASTTMTYLLRAQLEGTGSGSQSYYVSGNIRENLDGSKTSDAENVTYKYELYNDQVLDWTVFRSSPFFDHLATVESAEAAFKNVLSDVGCNQPELDNHDTRMVSETKHRTYTYTGAASLAKGRYGHIDSETDSEGFDGLNIYSATRDADWDTDGDGIPDWFEDAKGWGNGNLNNNHSDGSSVGWYTDLEIYLNWMACPHFIDLEMSVETEIDLATYFAGYTNPSYTIVSQDNGIGASISNNKLIVTPTSSGLFSVQVKATQSTQSNISLTRTFNFYVLPYQAPDENVYNEASTTTTTETINNSGNITWAFNDPNVPAVVSFGDDDVNALFTPKSISVGSNLSFVSSDLDESTYKSSVANEGSANDNNAIQFYVSLKSGYTFTPTSISVTASRFGTDGGKVDISWYANGSSTKYFTGVTPNRSNKTPNSSTYTQNLPNQSLTGTFGIKINIYSLGTDKKIGLKDIIINGIVSGEVTKSSTDIILKETATVYPKFNNAKETKFTLPINNANVTLERTLSNEYWNTLCLPFDVSSEQLEEVFGAGTKVSEFSSAVSNTINFSSVERITAGIPCVIKPTNTVENPVFENVNITSSSPGWIYKGEYHYDGHYICYDMKTDQTEYFLNTRGTLNYPANDSQNHLKGLRATFTIPKSSSASLASLRVFFDEKMVSEGLDLVDGVDAIRGLTNIATVYNLKGQVVGTTQDNLAKGVYIVDGKKVVIR